MINGIKKIDVKINSLNTELFKPNEQDRILNYYDSFKRKNYSTRLSGFKPDFKSSVLNIYDFIDNLFNEFNEIIVFGFDAISFEYYLKEINKHICYDQNSLIGMLSSVFPSTSSTAWSSILTGTTPSEHGIYGTSFFLEHFKKNYVWHRNTLVHKGQRTILTSEDEKFRLLLTNKPTLFQRLEEKGIISYSLGTHFKGEFKPLLNELYKGSVRLRINDSYLNFAEKPDSMVDYFLRQTSDLLAQNGLGDKMLIWNYIDTDYYIHKHGYEGLSNNITWKKVFDYWNNNSKEKRLFLFISDHGQIRQKNVELDIFTVSNANDHLAYDTAGAGRVLYLFPEKNKEKTVLDWIRGIVADTGKIFTKDELFDLGLIDKYAKGLNRIGDIIATAHSPGFPSTGYSYLYEHGAFEAEEMYVPIVLKY